MCSKFIFLFITCILVTTESARILGVVPTPSFSHQVVFRPIWKGLALRGHELIVLTTDPENDPSLPNLKEINLHGAYNYWNVTRITEKSQFNMLGILNEIFDMLQDIMDYELNHPAVQELLNNKTEHFDLVIVEYLFPAVAAFSARFHCPYIGVTSMDAPIFAHYVMGNPTNPVLYPDFQLPFIPPLNFIERVASTVCQIMMNILGQFSVVPMHEEIVKKYFGEETPNLTDILANLSMLFVNTNPMIHPIRPLTPTTIQIGGGAHMTPPKELPKDLKQFLDDAKDGFIYFSLGSNVKSASVSQAVKETILATFRKLPYRILWKFDIDIPEKSDNIKIINWGPQQDILRHPNIKVFIYQGGLQSTEEAINSHVPLVCMPFFGDQDGNALLIEKKELGIIVDKNSLSEESFNNAIIEVINNPKYKKKAKELADILSDQEMTGVEKAVWWTEYVLRHKGTAHLKSHAYELPAYQYFLLDVVGFTLAIVLVSIFLLFKLVKGISRRFFIKSGNLKLKAS